MRFINQILATLALVAAIAIAPAAHAQRGQSGQVIVISYDRIIQSSDVGRSMTSQLEAIAQQMQGEIQPEGTAIQQEQQSIQQATQGQTADQVRANRTLATRIETFNQRVEAFRARQLGLARDMEYTRQMTLNDFNQQVTPIVREVMEARGAGIVLDAGAVSLAQPGLDATDEVVQRLNQRLRTISVTRQSAPAPQQPPAPH